MLATARAGSFNFLKQLQDAVEEVGWHVEWHEVSDQARAAAPYRAGHALFHMEAPTHDRALTFRRAYFYPFWQIEPVAQRWRFDVAQSDFYPDHVDPAKAAYFTPRLRDRVLPGPEPSQGDYALVPLQGRIRACRSFQTMSPVEMVETVAATGRPTIATYHPKEYYSPQDREALEAVAARHANLTIGGNTMQLLRDCAFVATQNSAVAFEGFLLNKPAVLFGQSDFHHIALNVSELGASEALAQAPHHRPDFARYLFWFLRMKVVNATAPDAKDQIRRAMKKGGWSP